VYVPVRNNTDSQHYSCTKELEISFETKELRDLCEDESLAAQELGPIAAEALKRRLADIRAADAIYDVLAGRPLQDKHHGIDCYRFELADNCRLTVIPNHMPPRNSAAGIPDWERVRRVRVISLEP
jgi:hypothetical protein